MCGSCGKTAVKNASSIWRNVCGAAVDFRAICRRQRRVSNARTCRRLWWYHFLPRLETGRNMGVSWHSYISFSGVKTRRCWPSLDLARQTSSYARYCASSSLHASTTCLGVGACCLRALCGRRGQERARRAYAFGAARACAWRVRAARMVLRNMRRHAWAVGCAWLALCWDAFLPLPEELTPVYGTPVRVSLDHYIYGFGTAWGRDWA